MRKLASGACTALMAGLLASSALAMGDCIGQVVNVRPVLHYDHARGQGFLAVRAGPGAVHEQSGELYRGDQVRILARDGNWLAIECIAGQCLEPLWGPPIPRGWVYGRYLQLMGQCP